MVVIRPVARESFKGKNAKGIRIGNAFRDLLRYVVTRIENKAAALSGKNLQPQVSELHLAAGLTDTF